jgi:epoxyqueuosine reductase
MPSPTAAARRPSPSTDAATLADQVRAWAQAAGFDAVGITTPDAIPEAAGRLAAFLADGHHGDMGWMADTADRRGAPRALWPAARSVVMLGLSYAPAADPRDILQARHRGAISVYAQGRDYHDLIKGRLKQVARQLTAAAGADVKVFVDTAPLMEKPLAAASGLGWQGKHTNLVSRTHGSWLLLGAILTTAVLIPDAPARDHCGSCRRCLDVCPTDAFPAPYRLDARRCIAYLTIEHRGPIPPALRPAIGNRVFGCDDCLAVCPWNRFAARARETRLHGRPETDNPPLADLVRLDDAAFRVRFAGTPVKRTGRDRVVRNVLIAIGNSGERALLPGVVARLDDAAPVVRGAAVWALARLADASAVQSYAAAHAATEIDPDVAAEWAAAVFGATADAHINATDITREDPTR